MTSSHSELHYRDHSTLFAPGNGESSQIQVVKYIPKNQKIITTTHEEVRCEGRNNLDPIYVVHKPFIGPEMADVNLYPFDSYASYANPYKWFFWSRTSSVNNYFGIKVTPLPYKTTLDSVKFHSIHLSEYSLGQVTDIESHKRKYDAWLESKDRPDDLVLMGVSRGTSTTFCAMAKYKYERVKLVILEGAIDSIENILPQRAENLFKMSCLAKPATKAVYAGLSLFTKYDRKGPSPLNSVEEFPENIPVIFVTSKMDTLVTCENTENIAKQLAGKGKNDVYLLKLERSSHPNYMFDDKEDRDNYEAFVHAVKKKYGLVHDEALASKGERLVELCKLEPSRQELKFG